MSVILFSRVVLGVFSFAPGIESCSFTEVISVVFRAPVGRDPCYSDKWCLIGAVL